MNPLISIMCFLQADTRSGNLYFLNTRSEMGIQTYINSFDKSSTDN